MNKNRHNEKKKQFYCPLGYGIMWWRGFKYTECPLARGFRNMPECRDCELKTDVDFLGTKVEKVEEDKPRKRKRNKRRKRQ